MINKQFSIWKEVKLIQVSLFAFDTKYITTDL